MAARAKWSSPKLVELETDLQPKIKGHRRERERWNRARKTLHKYMRCGRWYRTMSRRKQICNDQTARPAYVAYVCVCKCNQILITHITKLLLDSIIVQFWCKPLVNGSSRSSSNNDEWKMETGLMVKRFFLSVYLHTSELESRHLSLGRRWPIVHRQSTDRILYAECNRETIFGLFRFTWMSNEAAVRSRRIAAQEKPAYSCMNCRVQKTLYRKSFMFFLVCTEHWPSNAENKNRTTEESGEKSMQQNKTPLIIEFWFFHSFGSASALWTSTKDGWRWCVCVVVVKRRE